MRRLNLVLIAALVGAAVPAAAAETGYLIGAGSARTVLVFKDAGALEQGVKMIADGSFRTDPARLKAFVACTAETGTQAQGQADTRIRRRRADVVEAYEVEVLGGEAKGCKGMVAPVNFGKTAPSPTAADRARQGDKPLAVREVGTLVPAEGRSDVTLWRSKAAREIGVPLYRQGVSLANLGPYVACTGAAGARVGLVDDGLLFRDVVLLDGKDRGCVGNVERGQFKKAEDQSLAGRLGDPSGAKEVAVWRDVAARLDGLKLVQAGVHRTEPKRVEALMACWAPSGAPASRRSLDPAQQVAQVEVTDGPGKGCQGVVAETAFRPLE